MKKQRIYIDTSVVGGYFDKEFSADTVPFFESVMRGEVTIILSDTLERELENAPSFVKKLLHSIPKEYKELVNLTQEAELLAEKYIEANVVGKTSLTDCQHIAMATTIQANVLLSWNFKHIVNLGRIRGYNGINIQQGYNTIEIRTPKEVINYENNQ